MELQPDFSPSRILKTSWTELRRARTDRRHPFRFFWFATTDGTRPLSRTVVLRDLPDPWTFRIYTDARSQKVAHLQQSPFAHLLFYHPKRQVQISIQATCELHHGDALAREAWERVNPHTHSDYHSVEAPGTPMDWDSKHHPLEKEIDGRHFVVIDCRAEEVDVLNLRREGHLRYRFSGSLKQWDVQRVVP